jgi:hypothetical protein
MNLKKLIFRTIAGTIVGEIALIALTTVAQEVIYHGISYNGSPTPDLILGGLLTVLAAVMAGVIAAFVGGKTNFWPHIFISIIIMTETFYLISKGVSNDPLWFDIMAGLSLVIGVWVGLLLKNTFWRKA